jgi:inositol hexakisphosphate/diphosphoinositol-pentakisphosphate kinase
LKTAELIVTPLCKKILNDLLFWQDDKFHEEEQYWKYKLSQDGGQDKHWRHVRTRLYFTSSSHIYSLYNILAYGNNGELLDSCEKEVREQVRRLIYIGYLSNIELKLYENLAAHPENPKRFRLELSFCPWFEPKNPSQTLVLGNSCFTIE